MQLSARVGAVLLYLAALSPLTAQSAKVHPNPAYITPAPSTNAVAFGAPPKFASIGDRGTLIGTIGQED